jgi:hypothetical protein
MGPRYIGEKKILSKKCTKMVFGLSRKKNKILSKINKKLVASNVFDLQNEFYDNRTWFGTYEVVSLSTSKFSPGRSVWTENFPIFVWVIRKKWSRDDLLTPRFQLRRFLLWSTHKRSKLNFIFNKSECNH